MFEYVFFLRDFSQNKSLQWINFQEAISDVFIHSFGYTKIAHRGGKSGGSDWLVTSVPQYTSATNCEEMCLSFESANDLDTFGGLQTVYYAKCFNSSGIIPYNKRRFAFGSQMGTTEIDSSLPMFINRTSCIRTSFKLVDFLKVNPLHHLPFNFILNLNQYMARNLLSDNN